LDGAARIDALLERAKALGMSALALTDHGNLYGALEFYRKAKLIGVKPILGYEAYVAPESRFHKDAASAKDAASHLTLLAIDREGFRNLIRLSSLAFLEGYYYRPRIDKELLAAHSRGLVCLSGCASSEISRLVSTESSDQFRQACEAADWYRQVFGDRFFLEVQNNGLEEQQIILRQTAKLAAHMGIPLVATSDVHYVRPEDAVAQDVLICVNTGKLRSDTDRMRMGSDQFYLRSPQEMYTVFSGLEEALARTAEIASWANIDLELGVRHFPVFHPPEGKSSEEFLRELCLQGLRERYRHDPRRLRDGQLAPEVLERLDRELNVINKLGFANYFLVVWDFVRFARERWIAANARGSGVGSLVAFALYLSPVCPIEYDLLFERFLDENRREAPDIDIDFCQQRRGEVIQYVKQRYGEENVAQIGTFGTLAARAAIRDVGRALGIPLARVNSIVAMVPERPGMTLDKAMEESEELRRAYESDHEVREIVDLARQVEGLARNAGTHAAGVVIADRPLTEYLPLQRVQGKEEIVTQWAMGDVEAVGLLKMDFLGLRNLTILSKVVELIEQTTGERVDPYSFPLDDPETFALLRRGETKGIFQLESMGIRELLQRMKPDHFRDIIATNALFRPGPLKGGMVDDYIDVKHGRKRPDYKHPVMEQVLAETHGVMVYQEQVMRILNRLGDIPLADAYTCIKAISKKKLPVIAKFREQFLEGARRQGLKKREAEEVFSLIEKFAGYGFNKSHSTAYALIAYITAYLKTHWPVPFMAALLSSDIPMRNFTQKDSLVEHLEDCRRMGIEILWPDINRSEVEFAVIDGKIAFGLAAIKGCGGSAAEAIVSERRARGPYRDLLDFCERLDPTTVSRSAIEALIKAGAFDRLGGHRAQWFEVLDRAIQAGAAAASDRRSGQLGLFGGPQKSVSSTAPRLPDVAPWPEHLKLAYEKEVLGFYLSSHPLAEYQSLLEDLCTHSVKEAATLAHRTEVILGGLVGNIRLGRTRQIDPEVPNRYANFDLEDQTGSIRCILWPEPFLRYGSLLKQDAKVVIAGTVDRRGDIESVTLIANEIVPMEELPQRCARGLAIRICEARHTLETVDRLARLLAEFPGESPIRVVVELLDGTRVPMSCEALRVDITGKLREKLDELLGIGYTRIITGTPFRRANARNGPAERSRGRNGQGAAGNGRSAPGP